MDVREATAEDIDGIRSVARASLTESYGHALSEDVIDRALEKWYDEEDLADDLVADDTLFVVGLEHGQVVAFAECYLAERRTRVGEIDWIHVDPEHRGEGFGEQLLKRLETLLADEGAELFEGRVLQANQEGIEFYERQGYEQTGERRIEVADQEFEEYVFTKFAESAEGRQVLVESRLGPDGQRLFIAYDESKRASKSPFYTAYEDRQREVRYGYFCGNCESFDTAVDTMDRIECNDCGNRSKPTRWDDSYL